MSQVFDKQLVDWQVTVLPVPKRHFEATGLGFCGGFAVGYSETDSNTHAQWWYEGQPVKITCAPYKHVEVRFARGNVIAGYWEKNGGAKTGALKWTLANDSDLVPLELQSSVYKQTAAFAASGNYVVGVGDRKPILWMPDASLIQLSCNHPADVGYAVGVDDTWVVGWLGETGIQRATMWSCDGKQMVNLGLSQGVTMARGVRDGEQVGEL